MGLHTSRATRTEEGYVGLGVHRAARICDAGPGGQILLWNATREVLADDRWQAAEESGGRLALEQVRAPIDEAPRDRARVIEATDRQQ